ncbi:hypothetical protein [Pseudomonas brenneri]|uniref:hypothetical protein n=1 Tax=Pseudomonas brenneri TaxID=129817 RepID=UPI003BA114EE
MGAVSSRSSNEFRRSWEHIRDDKVNAITLSYVKSGGLSVTQGDNVSELRAGDFTFTRTTNPLYCKNCVINGKSTEWYFIVFPPDLVYRHFPHGIPICTRLTAPPGRQLILAHLMTVLSEEGESLGSSVVDDLISALLKTCSDIAVEQGVEAVSRQSIGEKRMEGVISLISLNLSNPDFSLTAAAAACKISTRYLCHVLRDNGTSFLSCYGVSVWRSPENGS